MTAQSPTSVYRYYDKFGILLYVGITSQRTARNQQHNRDKDWWPLVVKQEVEHYDSRESAEVQEAELIRKNWTPFNKQHNTDHANARAMYQRFLTSGVADRDPSLVFRECNHTIPLDVEHKDNGKVVFRSRLDHSAVTRRIRFTPNVRVCDTSTSFGVGEIGSLEKAGPLLQITTTHIRNGVEFGRAFAKVKQVPGKGDPVFELRRVYLAM